ARLALYGVLINCVLATVKIVSGMVGHSYALIADGIESTLDIFSSLVIWGGLTLAARPPDVTHPYGHGKAEPLAAIAVSLLIVIAALGLAAESVHEILVPHHAPAPFTLVVLVVVVLIKEWLFRRVAKASEKAGSAAMKADAWHHRADAITSIAAFIGISIAIIGGAGYEPADDWAALFACCLIGFNGLALLRPAIDEIMDIAPPVELAQSIREVAAKVPGVVELEQCRMRKMGLEYYVDIHVEVDASLTVREGHEIAHAVKDAIRTANPAVADVLVHVEPADQPGG
ncbi:MAG TPA: cation diffusion facilitator family transporter, partial [Chthoniobacteraceae bacterium]